MASIIRFFLEVKSELAKVVWPSRQETIKYTAAVILISVAVAVILGAVDYGLIKLLETFINK